MKKVLLPTDFSENALRAIHYAIRLFKNEICTFYLLHAYHSVPSATGNMISAREDLQRLVKKLTAENGKSEHHFEQIIEMDTLFSLTERAMTENAVDYVVMGTQGTSALREVFLGSYTMDLIKHLNHGPIIAIPPGYDGNGLQEIVFATDFKHTFRKPELAPLIELAKLNNATLNIIYIKKDEMLSDTQKSNKKMLRNALKGTRHQFFELERQGSVAKTLYQLEKGNSNIGMVALLKTKHGFFKNLTRETVLKHMVYKTEVPLLVLPIVD